MTSRRRVEGQGSVKLGEVADARLSQELCRVLVGAVGVGGVDTVDVFDDCQAGGSERVGEEERTGVGPVGRDA